jgi:hypothetical protein
MTTIARLKQLKAWMTGQQRLERVERKPQDMKLDRFTSYRDKIIPKLQASGYVYFLACASNDYQEHEEWCHANCEDFTLPHCDVWQFDSKYPRAFASQADAMLFCLTFDAYDIEGDEQ